MKTLKFKCELLSDVILNQRAASTGPNETLDFIPGSCFLGIVAEPNQYKTLEKENIAFDLFHSGKVRFGDAHPVYKGSVIRGLKVPAAFYHKKGEALKDCYISHFVDWDDDDIKEKQLKQAREGFYDFNEQSVKKFQIETSKNFAIKSSYDRDRRCSKDKQLYCYESLEQGLTMFFSVDICDEKFESIILESLTGVKRVGRSRTSQYGLVDIQPYDFCEIESTITESNEKYVYADSRLIFMDSYGLPTCRPTAKDLGFENGIINWEKSQIRTFQYSPWNYQRQCFDSDRYGIEKGSVFVVDSEESPANSQYVGSFNCEGFGKVIYNPYFLLDADEGRCPYSIAMISKEKPEKYQRNDKQKHIDALKSFPDNPLLQYLGKQKQEELDESKIYDLVNAFVNDNKRGQLFKNGAFASQWSSIRAIAMKNSTFEQLEYELFSKKRDVEKKNDRGEKIIIKEPFAYLTHGVALEKWKAKGRLDIFKDFFYTKLKNTEGNFAQRVLINLASQMAKECKK